MFRKFCWDTNVLMGYMFP